MADWEVKMDLSPGQLGPCQPWMNHVWLKKGLTLEPEPGDRFNDKLLFSPQKNQESRKIRVHTTEECPDNSEGLLEDQLPVRL